MLDFYCDYLTYEELGKIDNTHLVYADKSEKLALDEKCLKLADLHGEAVINLFIIKLKIIKINKG